MPWVEVGKSLQLSSATTLSKILSFHAPQFLQVRGEVALSFSLALELPRLQIPAPSACHPVQVRCGGKQAWQGQALPRATRGAQICTSELEEGF